MKKHGFTVVELLVSVSVVSVLLSLLVVAVSRSREAARKADCANRMRQFGVAMHAFEASNRELPFHGGPWLKNAASQFAAGYSVQAQLLSYLGQPAEAARLDLSRKNSVGWALEPAVGIFWCPSDRSVDRGTNVRATTGSGAYSRSSGDASQGIFGAARGTHLREIQDGLSHTVSFSERTRSDEDLKPLEKHVDLAGTGAVVVLPAGTVVTADEMGYLCKSLTGDPVGYSSRVGWQWSHDNAVLTDYNHVAAPNSRVGDCALDTLHAADRDDGSGNFTQNGVQMTARSNHVCGVHCLFTDGSVRLVADAIDLSAWRASATICGFEVLEF